MGNNTGLSGHLLSTDTRSDSAPQGPTPGPWSVCEDDPTQVRDTDGDLIADCRRFTYTDDGEIDCPDNEANARLIASALLIRDALVAAKQEMWMAARDQWTMADFKNWAVIQQIDAALDAARPTPTQPMTTTPPRYRARNGGK